MTGTKRGPFEVLTKALVSGGPKRLAPLSRVSLVSAVSHKLGGPVTVHAQVKLALETGKRRGSFTCDEDICWASISRQHDLYPGLEESV